MLNMLQYTDETLNKMLKRELIPIVLSFQNKMTEDNNTMLHKIHKFSDNFAKLHAEPVVKMEWNVSAGQMPSTQEEHV